MSEQLTILALASEFKGVPFLQTAKELGARILLLTSEEYANHPWPMEVIDEKFDMPDLRKQPDVTHAVSYLARDRHIHRIVALDDFDVEHAASLREHMRLQGMGDTIARHFRDKLAMRTRAKQAGINVPAFVGIFNYDDLRTFMSDVPAPWVFKPRFEAGSEGIRKFHHSEELWRTLDTLGDQKSYHLLEEFVAGDVYHVDALTWEGKVVFSVVSKYGAPPMAVLQGRKVFTTRILPRDSEEATTLRALNIELLKAMGLPFGVSHAEFIRAEADGEFYFLENAARVGGGNIDKLVESATGVVLWAEMAKMVIAHERGETYTPPTDAGEYAGLIACPSHTPFADTSSYTDPEIRFRPRSEEFASLIVGSSSPERVQELLGEYAKRFMQDFMV